MPTSASQISLTDAKTFIFNGLTGFVAELYDSGASCVNTNGVGPVNCNVAQNTYSNGYDNGTGYGASAQYQLDVNGQSSQWHDWPDYCNGWVGVSCASLQ